MGELRLHLDGLDGLAGARGAVRRLADEAGSSLDSDVIELLCDELVVNALEHGPGACDVVARTSPSGVRVEVLDHSPDPPKLDSPDGLDERGRGLWLVDRFASSWGTSSTPGDGKVVWFEAGARARL